MMRKMGTGVTAIVAAIGFIFVQLVVPVQVFALDKYFVGPRAMGMAGANVASVNDNSAQYYNPAAFGFFSRYNRSGAEKKKEEKEKKKSMAVDGRSPVDNNNLAAKDWRLSGYAGAGYRLHNNMADLLDDLSSIDFNELSVDSIENAADLQNLVKATEILNRVDEPGSSISVDSSAGVSFGFSRVVIGTYAFFQANARVTTVDTANLQIAGAANINNEINAVTLSGNDGATSFFTASQQAQLIAAGLNAAAVQKLDFAARQVGVDQGTLQSTIDIMVPVIQQTTGAVSGGDIKNNTTSARLEGFGHYEVPVSYGHAFNDNFAVGGNVKLITGRVYGRQIRIFNNDAGDILEDVDKDYKETSTFGIDLGAMYRIKRFNFGLVARNINAPEFDGPTVGGIKFDDQRIDPSVTAGAAFIPYEGMTLEVDYDLTKGETAFPGYDVQNLSVGYEWLWLRFLSLRLGGYKNMAESDIGWVYTAGLGLNIFGVRLDAGGAYSSDTGQFDNDNVPEEGRVVLQLSFDY